MFLIDKRKWQFYNPRSVELKKMAKEKRRLTQEVEKIYDKQAGDFAEHAPTLLWWKHVGVPAYDRNIGGFYGRKEVKALDLGSASGRVPQLLIERGIPPENIMGVEISGEQVAIARKRVPKATFIHGDITEVELPSNTFDLVTSNMVFEFLDPEGLTKAVKNAHGSLKSGGTLFFVTTHPDKMKKDSGLKKPGRFEVAFPWGGSGPNYYRTKEDFRSALEKSGFEIDKVEELGIPPEAEKDDPVKFEAFNKYKHIRLAVKSHKPQTKTS